MGKQSEYDKNTNLHTSTHYSTDYILVCMRVHTFQKPSVSQPRMQDILHEVCRVLQLKFMQNIYGRAYNTILGALLPLRGFSALHNAARDNVSALLRVLTVDYIIDYSESNTLYTLVNANFYLAA